jgi:uncharacterized phage protein (TIGR02218 family)
MTYIATDGGAVTGNPVELYEYSLGAGVFHRFTSFDKDYTYLSNVYASVPLQRGEIESTTDVNTNNLTVSVPQDNPVAALFIGASQKTPTTMTLYRLHEDDGEAVVHWKGRFLGITGNGSNVQLEHESIYSSILRPGLRSSYTRNCNHVLYDEDPVGCSLNKDDFAIAGNITGLSGLTVTVDSASSYDDGWFTGGLLKDTFGFFGFITAHVGDSLSLLVPVGGLEVSQAVTLYPGCDLLKTTCDEKFDNSLNFAGRLAYVPKTSGQDGSSVL